MQRAAIEAIERATFQHFVIIHRAQPQPAQGIDGRIVGAVVSGHGDRSDLFADGALLEPEDAVSRADEHAALICWHDETGHAAHREGLAGTRCRHMAVDPATLDIDEPQCLLFRAPDRTFAQLCAQFPDRPDRWAHAAALVLQPQIAYHNT